MFEDDMGMVEELAADLEKSIALRDQWGDEMSFDTDKRHYVLRSFALEFDTAYGSLEEAQKEAKKRVSREGNSYVVVSVENVVMPHHQVEVVDLNLSEIDNGESE